MAERTKKPTAKPATSTRTTTTTTTKPTRTNASTNQPPATKVSHTNVPRATASSKAAKTLQLRSVAATTTRPPKPTPTKATSLTNTQTKVVHPLTALYDPKTAAAASRISSHRNAAARVVVPVAAPTTPTTAKANNVMNSVHNVTVASPPLSPRPAAIGAGRRPRDIREALQLANPQQDVDDVIGAAAAQHRDRTRTHTLGADEVLVLGRQTQAAKILPPPQQNIVVRDPIAFDIQLDDGPPSFKAIPTNKVDDNDDDDVDDEESYEDDFDSYESDFESCSSSASASAADASSMSPEPTTMPSLQIEATDELKVANSGDGADSGMYELKPPPPSTATVPNVLADQSLPSAAESTQPDSGFCVSSTSPIPIAIHQPNAPKPARIGAPGLSSRHQQLTAKISLDTMSYTLFELRPVPYAQFMRQFGRHNGTQAGTQTAQGATDQDSQTDVRSVWSAWTQLPISLHDGSSYEQRQGCGRDADAGRNERHAISADDEEEADVDSGLEASLNALAAFEMNVSARPQRWKPDSSAAVVDAVRLGDFMRRAESIVATVWTRSERAQEKPIVSGSGEMLPGSLGYVTMGEMDDLIAGYPLRSLLGDGGDASSLLFGVHAANDDELLTFVSVWKLMESAERPRHVLRCWSRVRCMLADASRGGVIYAGLADGLVAVWNVSQTLDDLTTEDRSHPPCQLIRPECSTMAATEIGPVVVIRSDTQFDQVFTLHEGGLLSAWSIRSIGRPQPDSKPTASPSSSSSVLVNQLAPSARVALVPTAHLDLAALYATEALQRSAGRRRPRSGFERTLALFESNVFSDAALQELQSADAEQRPSANGPSAADDARPLRCFDVWLNAAAGELTVATNRPAHLVQCSRSLHPDTVRRLPLGDGDAPTPHHSRHATRLMAVAGEAQLAVGCSDGSVQLVCTESPLATDYRPDSASSLSAADVHDVAASDERRHDAFDDPRVYAKSCTIQSLIEAERSQTDDADDRRRRRSGVVSPAAATDEESPEHQLLLSTTASRQRILHGLSFGGSNAAVRWMVSVPALRALFVRSAAGEMRVFDFASRSEQLLQSRAGSFVDCVWLGRLNRMAALRDDDSVQLHQFI